MDGSINCCHPLFHKKFHTTKTNCETVMITKNSECALRCLLFLMNEGVGVPVLCRDIAHAVDVSEPCVAGVLRILAKRGVLESLKGKGGGFALRPEAVHMSAYEILMAVNTEGESRIRCLLGQKECSDLHPCPLHHAWLELQQRQEELLKNFRIGEFSLA